MLSLARSVSLGKQPDSAGSRSRLLLATQSFLDLSFIDVIAASDRVATGTALVTPTITGPAHAPITPASALHKKQTAEERKKRKISHNHGMPSLR